jgi:hypothetical protein
MLPCSRISNTFISSTIVVLTTDQEFVKCCLHVCISSYGMQVVSTSTLSTLYCWRFFLLFAHVQKIRVRIGDNPSFFSLLLFCFLLLAACCGFVLQSRPSNICNLLGLHERHPETRLTSHLQEFISSNTSSNSAHASFGSSSSWE